MQTAKNWIRKGWIGAFLGLISCTENPERVLYGSWRELGMSEPAIVQGVVLGKHGVAQSFGSATLRYEAWKRDGARLILEGTSIGNGQELPFADSLEIVSCQKDTLILGVGADYRRVYVRQPDDRTAIELKSLTGEEPVRLLFEPDSATVQLWLSPDQIYALSRWVRPDGTSVWNWEDDDTYQVEKRPDGWGVSRRGKLLYSVSGEGTDRPSRSAYEGFHWEYLSGAGMGCWAQRNASIRLMIDPLLPGLVMVRDGDSAPQTLVRIFDLPDGKIENLQKLLAQEPGWNPEETARFQEKKCDREGVRRFVLVPDGAYARRMDSLMQREPVPVTCSGWGVGNSGMRYFEIQDSHPNRVIFMEIGQEAPLFDEQTFRWEETRDSVDSRDMLRLVSGELRIGHEVRSLTLEDGSGDYWVVDKTGTLLQAYDEWTDGNKNGKPLDVQLRVEYNGKWTDGFAAEYDGVFLVREVVRLGPAK